MEDEAVVSEEPGRLESEELARRSLGPVLNRVLARMEELGELPEGDEGERLWRLQIPLAHVFVVRTPGKPGEAWEEELESEESEADPESLAVELPDEEIRKVRRETARGITTFFAENEDRLMVFSSEYERMVGIVYGNDKEVALLQLEQAIRKQNEKNLERGLRPMECAVHLAEIDHLILSRRGNGFQILIPGRAIGEASAAIGSFDQILEDQQELKQSGEHPPGAPILFTKQDKGIQIEAAGIGRLGEKFEQPQEETYLLLCGGEDEVQSPFNRGKEIVVRQEDLKSDQRSYQLNQAFRGDDPFSIDEVKRLLESKGKTSLNPGERRLIKNLSKGVRGKVDFSGSSRLTIEASNKGQLGEMIEETEKYMDRLVRMGEVLGIRFEQHTSDSFIFWVLPENELGLGTEAGGERLSIEERTLVFGWLADKLFREMSRSGEWLSGLETKVIAQILEDVPMRISMGQQGELSVDIGGSDFNFETLMEKLAKRGFTEDASRVSLISKTRNFVMDKVIAKAVGLSEKSGFVTERKMNVAEETLEVCALDPGRSEFETIILKLLAKDEAVREMVIKIMFEEDDSGQNLKASGVNT